MCRNAHLRWSLIGFIFLTMESAICQTAHAQRGGGGGRAGGNAASGAGGLNHGTHGPQGQEHLGGHPDRIYGVGGYGWGAAYGADMFTASGMSLADQQMVNEARLAEINSRIQLSQMQTQLAYQQALHANQQMMLAQSRARRPVRRQGVAAGETVASGDDLSQAIRFDTVDWPLKSALRKDTLAKRDEVDKAILAVYQQVLAKGYAEKEAVFEAKQKLRLFQTDAQKGLRVGTKTRNQFLAFVRGLDEALSLSLRSPEPRSDQQRPSEDD
jgi:hypothetical protein